jgi:hypothetical protein
MTCRKLVGLALVCAAFGFAPSQPAAFAQPTKDGPIKVGMVKYFFNDLEPAFIAIGNDMFKDVMKACTGLDGESNSHGDAFETARKIDSNELQLGVFHGHEFAWIQKKHPKLLPMAVVMNKYQEVRVYVVVHKDSPSTNLASLRGKSFSLPMLTKQHCVVEMTRHFTDNGQPDAKGFFGSLVRSKNPIMALDEVASKKVDAVIVDTVSLEFYKQENGPRFEKNLRVLHQSEPFPPPVIVYKEGNLSAATLGTMRDGLLRAHTNRKCDELLAMWQIRGFEQIPSNYQELLGNSVKSYVPPAGQR